MKNFIIPMNGSKDKANLERLLSSMNDREIQEIYTHVRIKEISGYFMHIATEELTNDDITYNDFTIIEKHQKELATHFMDVHDWIVSDYDLITEIIEEFLNDMRNRPVIMLAYHNHKLYSRKFKTLFDAQKAMLQKIEIIMGSKGIQICTDIPVYQGVNCGWDSSSAWVYLNDETGSDEYDWKIVYESDIPSNS